MTEEIDIEIGVGRDSIEGIEETGDKVIINYTASGQTRPIIIEREIIDFVKECIDNMEVGEPYHSKYIYNRYITHFRVVSQLIRDRLPIIEESLARRALNKPTIKWIMEELRENDKFMLMSFKEMIGSREIKSSHYFKVYGAIRYWVHKEIIDYNQRGTIVRLI